MHHSTASILLLLSAAPIVSAFAPLPTKTARFHAVTAAQEPIQRSTSFSWNSGSDSSNFSSSTSLFSSTDTNINYVISGDNIELTEALNGYINKKLDNVIGKLATSGAIKECDVHLSVNKNPKVKNAHKAEVVTYLKGVVIRCAEESQDMYASIDAVTDRLASKLRKYKERRLDGYHGGPNMGENLANVLDEVANLAPAEESVDANDQDYVDPEAPVVTKIKR
jgi:putative sigma-54 modulation protein